MARPAFKPDAQQAATERALTRQAERIQQADVDFTALIVRAKDQGIPIEHIARAARVTVKTIYSRLARIDRSASTDQVGYKSPSTA